eukprot:443017-Rhodomonas_salina.1
MSHRPPPKKRSCSLCALATRLPVSASGPCCLFCAGPSRLVLAGLRWSMLVYAGADVGARLEQLVKMSNTALDLDRAYTLYAVSRRATQEFAGASLGKGTISAVNLMEFDSKMEAARQSHQNCELAPHPPRLANLNATCLGPDAR